MLVPAELSLLQPRNEINEICMFDHRMPVQVVVLFHLAKKREERRVRGGGEGVALSMSQCVCLKVARILDSAPFM